MLEEYQAREWTLQFQTTRNTVYNTQCCSGIPAVAMKLHDKSNAMLFYTDREHHDLNVTEAQRTARCCYTANCICHSEASGL